jgi:hypothetical protein
MCSPFEAILRSGRCVGRGSLLSGCGNRQGGNRAAEKANSWVSGRVNVIPASNRFFGFGEVGRLNRPFAEPQEHALASSWCLSAPFARRQYY